MIHYNVDYFFAGLFDIILPPRACELVWRFFVKIICHKTLVYLFNNNVLASFSLFCPFIYSFLFFENNINNKIKKKKKHARIIREILN